MVWSQDPLAPGLLPCTPQRLTEKEFNSLWEITVAIGNCCGLSSLTKDKFEHIANLKTLTSPSYLAEYQYTISCFESLRETDSVSSIVRSWIEGGEQTAWRAVFPDNLEYSSHYMKEALIELNNAWMFRGPAFKEIDDRIRYYVVFEIIRLYLSSGDLHSWGLRAFPGYAARTTHSSSNCISCGACIVACPNGSAMLLIAGNIDPRSHSIDRNRKTELVRQFENNGFGPCSNHRECEAVCPKEIKISSIKKLNTSLLTELRREG